MPSVSLAGEVWTHFGLAHRLIDDLNSRMMSRIIGSGAALLAMVALTQVAIAQSTTSLPAVDWPTPEPDETRLVTYPQSVYFTTANAKLRTAASTFHLGVDTPADAKFVAGDLLIEYLSHGEPVRSDRRAASVLRADTGDAAQMYPPDVAASRSVPYAVSLTIQGPNHLPFDAVRFTLAASVDGEPRTLSLTVPAVRYEQKTSLVFPFQGPGIVTAGSALSGGHTNRSGLYAIDALGLGLTYGPLLDGEGDEDPTNFAGWSREIIAPAAGKVVYIRDDRVDQPVAGKSDPAYFLPQYKRGGDPGNFIIIDHENGEFSMIAHLKKDSARVNIGDRVDQGQILALMGNSGDTSGPHVHYQLQNGPDWERSDALPANFENVSSLTPGSYFNSN